MKTNEAKNSKRLFLGRLGGTTLISVVLTLLLGAALLAFNYWSATLDRAPVMAHVREAYAAGDLGLEKHWRTNTREGAHQQIDCLILSLIVDERATPLQRSLSPLGMTEALPNDNACVWLHNLSTTGIKTPPQKDLFYHRYVHGLVAVNAPLVQAMPIKSVRTLYETSSFLLTFGLAVVSLFVTVGAAKRNDRRKATRGAFIFVTAVTLSQFFGLQFYGMNFNHAPADSVIYLYLWLALFVDFTRIPGWLSAVIHAVFGILTAYLEFLAGGLPLGLCTLFMIFAANAIGDTRKVAVERAVLGAIAYMVGFVGLFVLKLSVTAYVFGPDIFGDFATRLAYRSGTHADAGQKLGGIYFDLPLYLLAASHYIGAGSRLVGAALLVGSVAVFLAACVRLYLRRKRTQNWAQPVLLIVSFMTIVGWYVAMSQHAAQHNFFMVRIAAGMIFSAALLYLVTAMDGMSKLITAVTAPETGSAGALGQKETDVATGTSAASTAATFASEGAQSTTSQASTLELTILMPCLNEAETLEVCVRKAMGFLERSGVSGEVVVADNGSTDGSQAIATAAGARVVNVPSRGYGAALMGGIAGARGRYVIMGDADDSYDFERLEPFVERLRSGAELVMGNRFKGGISPGAMPPLHRYLGNPVLSFLGRLFFRIPIGDFHCGLRGFSRDAINRLGLKSPGMEFASEMVVKASLQGLKMDEVPTTLRPDGRTRPPHLKTWRDGWRHLRFLLLHSPRWLFITPGLTLMALGLLGTALLAFGAVRVLPTLELDVHSLIVSCFAIVLGAQLVMFGAVARQYATIEGFLPPSSKVQGFLTGLNLERTLQLALVLLILGAGGAIWAFAYWAGTGFGEIEYSLVLRGLVISMTMIVVAVQAGASAFLASVFHLRK